MIINKNWLFNVYRNADAGEDAGGGAATTGVQAETDNTDTGDNTAPAAVDNSDAGNPADDTGSNDAAGETDSEGSQTIPDTYADFAMPEGVTVDSALLNDAAPLFKELGLTQDQAQKLVDFQAKQVQASSQSQVDAFDQLMNDWKTQTKNHKEFGGDKFEENLAIASKAMQQFGNPEFNQLMEEHGVGNHPGMFELMVNVGKLTAEDVPGGTTVPTSNRVPSIKNKGDDVTGFLYANDRNG